jgi:small subunit ribosomal protein S11
MTEIANNPAEVTPAPKKAEAKGSKKKLIKGRKKKAIKIITVGNAFIKATYNNTIISLTDQNGNVLSWSSAGINGFKGPKKATPYAASIIVRDAVEKSKVYGLRDVNVFVRGVGMGRESAVRALNANGLNVLAIKDTTPIPHNGCRQRKPRRV